MLQMYFVGQTTEIDKVTKSTKSVLIIIIIFFFFFSPQPLPSYDYYDCYLFTHSPPTIHSTFRNH